MAKPHGRATFSNSALLRRLTYLEACDKQRNRVSFLSQSFLVACGCGAFHSAFFTAEQMSTTDINASDSPIRVFLLIENRLLRESLARLFRNRPDLLVVAQGGQNEGVPRLLLDSQSEVLVTDVFISPWLQANLAHRCEGGAALRVVLIGMELDDEQFLAAARSGVTGYLLKDASASDVVAAVRAVFRGEAVCPPQLCSTLFRVVVQTAKDMPAQPSAPRPDLTLRQQQLVALVAKGLTNKEIASHLNLSEFTVRNHIHRILKQVDAANRSEAVDAIRAYGYRISP